MVCNKRGHSAGQSWKRKPKASPGGNRKRKLHLRIITQHETHADIIQRDLHLFFILDMNHEETSISLFTTQRKNTSKLAWLPSFSHPIIAVYSISGYTVNMNCLQLTLHTSKLKLNGQNGNNYCLKNTGLSWQYQCMQQLPFQQPIWVSSCLYWSLVC